MSKLSRCVLKNGYTVELKPGGLLCCFRHGKHEPQVLVQSTQLDGVVKINIWDEKNSLLKITDKRGFLSFLGVTNWLFTPFLPPAVVASPEFARLQDSLADYLLCGRTTNSAVQEFLARGNATTENKATMLTKLCDLRDQLNKLIGEVVSE